MSPRAPRVRRGPASRAARAGEPSSSMSRPGTGRPAVSRPARRRPRGAAPGGQRGRHPLRRYGAGPTGRRHVLPLSHAAQPRTRQARARLSHGSVALGESEDALAQRLARDEARARVELLKAEIEREIRERLVEDRGAEALAKSVRKPLPEDLDVMHANRDEMAQLERALRPLQPKAGGAPRAPPAPRATAGRWTFATPCGAASRPAACRSTCASSRRARPSPRSSSSPTSRVRSPRSRASPCTWCTRSARSSPRSAVSSSSTASTR